MYSIQFIHSNKSLSSLRVAAGGTNILKSGEVDGIASEAAGIWSGGPRFPQASLRFANQLHMLALYAASTSSRPQAHNAFIS